jgi:hypothetical protein
MVYMQNAFLAECIIDNLQHVGYPLKFLLEVLLELCYISGDTQDTSLY